MSEVNATLRLTAKDDATVRLKVVRAEMENLQKATDSTKKNAGSLGQTLESVANRFGLSLRALGAAGAATALVYVGRSAIQAASDLNELTSKAQFVYGDAFPKIDQAATKVAAEVGRARSQILGMAADYGAIIQPMGISTDKAGEMSVAFSKLAVDMSSFHNVRVEDAFVALRSAITGETEPMKRFGIVMTQTNLAAYALQKGIKTKMEAMNQAQLVALRYSYVMEKTKGAQGDAARTAGALANQMRQLQGNVKTAFEELGKPVLPVAARLMQELNLGVKGGILMFHEFQAAIGGALADLNRVAVLLAHLTGFSNVGVVDYRKDAFANFLGDRNLSLEDVAKYKTDFSKQAKTTEDKGLQDWIKTLGGSGTGTASGAAGTAKDAIKKASDAMRDMGNTYTDISRTVVQKLVDLDTAHRDKMKGFRDQIDQTTKSIKDLESQYTRTLGEINKSDADAIAGNGEKIADVEKKLAQLTRQRQFIYEAGGGIPLELTDEIDATKAELEKLKAAQTAALTNAPSGVTSAYNERKDMTDLERTLADSQTRRDELKAEYDERKAQLDGEMTAIKDKQTAEEQAYQTQRTQLQLTQTAMQAFYADYSARMGDLKSVTDETVDSMNAKLKELQDVISAIDELMQANAAITGGQTLSERSAARGAARLSDIPRFGDGGVVYGATLAIVGEKGPEKITPLGKDTPAQQTITIGPFYVSEKVDVNEVVNAITRKIQLQTFSSS